MAIQLKRHPTDYWESQNPIPKSGEVCIEEVSSGVYRFKIGTETTPWNSLYYPVTFTVGDNFFSGIQNFSSGVISTASLKNYSEVITNISIVNSGISIDFNSGNIFKTTLNSNVTGISFLNTRPSGTSHSCTLVFDYISSGRSVIWPSNILWNGGSGAVPSLSSGIGKSAIFSFFTIDGGSKFFGFIGGVDFRS